MTEEEDRLPPRPETPERLELADIALTSLKQFSLFF